MIGFFSSLLDKADLMGSMVGQYILDPRDGCERKAEFSEQSLFVTILADTLYLECVSQETGRHLLETFFIPISPLGTTRSISPQYTICLCAFKLSEGFWEVVSFVVTALLTPYFLQRLHVLIKWGRGNGWKRQAKVPQIMSMATSLGQGRKTKKESSGGLPASFLGLF